MKKILTTLTAAVFALSLVTVSFAGSGPATGTAGASAVGTSQKAEVKEGVKTHKKAKKHVKKHVHAAQKAEVSGNKADAKTK